MDVKRYRDENGLISFSLPATDGTTGDGWIARLTAKGIFVGDRARSLLLSDAFEPTSGRIYQISILRGEIFKKYGRVTKKIRDKASSLGLSSLTMEMACLIREMFTDEEIRAMDLSWIVCMHEPIKDYSGGSKLLLFVSGTDVNCLSVGYGESDGNQDERSGFAFGNRRIRA